MPTTPRDTSAARKWFLSSPPVEWLTTQLKELLIGALRTGPVPEHVAFVMDGNRRFARKNHMETVEGHNMGFEALAKILEVCYKSGVTVVTIYAFSIENFKRPKFEVDALMEILKIRLMEVCQHGDLLDRYGASLRILGRRNLVRPDVQAVVDKAVDMTKHNNRAILNVCFPYTSRDEMATAVRSLVSLSTSTAPAPASPPLNDNAATASTSSTDDDDASDASDATATPGLSDFESITEQTITEQLFTAGCPPVDLLVRTSGVRRLSDFMLWQSHKDTDIVFADTLWPQFDIWTFLPILIDWGVRRKRAERARESRKVQST